MTLIWFAAERLAECSTIALSIFFFYRCLRPKLTVKAYRYIAAICLILIRLAYYATGWGYRQYFALFTAFVFAHYVFKGSVRTHLLWALISIVTDGIIEAVVINAYLLIPGANYSLIDLPGWPRAVLLVSSKV